MRNILRQNRSIFFTFMNRKCLFLCLFISITFGGALYLLIDGRFKAQSEAAQFALNYCSMIPENSLKIPHNLHQSWKNTKLPLKFQRYQKSILENHPNWNYTLWTDEDNERLIREKYPWFLPTYRSFEKNIMRVDSVRYFYMYEYGGVYMDLDFKSYKPLDPLVDKHTKSHMIFGRMGKDKSFPHSIPNAFFCFCSKTSILVMSHWKYHRLS